MAAAEVKCGIGAGVGLAALAAGDGFVAGEPLAAAPDGLVSGDAFVSGEALAVADGLISGVALGRGDTLVTGEKFAVVAGATLACGEEGEAAELAESGPTPCRSQAAKPVSNGKVTTAASRLAGLSVRARIGRRHIADLSNLRYPSRSPLTRKVNLVENLKTFARQDRPPAFQVIQMHR